MLPKRVLIAVGGLLLLAVGALITVGLELIGVAAIVATWFLMRRRKRTLTRLTAWFVSVGSTAVPVLVFFAVTMMATPTPTPEQQKQALAAAQARRRDSMPEFLKKVMTRQQQQQQQQTSAAADSITQRLLQNRGFMVWLEAVGAMMASGMAAVFAGTIAWAATMLLFRAITDDWMGAVAPPLAAAVEE